MRIGESVFYPLDDPHQIGEFFERLVAIARGITDPFEQSFFLLVQIPYLQPFLDVNKRVSRLAANIPFIRGNISPLSFIDVEQKTYILGMLSVYERNNVSILRDMYVWAYERSAARYAAILESIGEPDVFRLEMRLRIKDVVSQVISANLGRSEAADFLAKYSTEISPDKRAEFVAVCMDELNSLHSGNFARYKVRPTQFEAWQKIWLAS